MITFRAVRGAALSAVAAAILLAGMTGSAKAQTPIGGGGSSQGHIFTDSPNRKSDANLAIGWDLLEHGGWGSTYGWNVSRVTCLNSDRTDSSGHLYYSAQAGAPPGTEQNNVWSGGECAPDHKDLDTLTYMKSQFHSGFGTCYYEYVMHYTGTITNPMTNVVTHDDGEITGGIHSYGL